MRKSELLSFVSGLSSYCAEEDRPTVVMMITASYTHCSQSQPSQMRKPNVPISVNSNSTPRMKAIWRMSMANGERVDEQLL